jgi:uncharacterized damage-inducible protein DinB
MRVPFPEPTQPVTNRAEVLLGYLDYFRDQVIERVESLPEREQRTSRVPSGWTPLELVRHLTFVELRWLEWGFEGRDVDDPWGDQLDRRWHAPPEASAADLLEALGARRTRTTEVVRAHDLADIGVPGDRWDGAEPAGLERVLLHLIQEYARHAGHLDIVVEQAGGSTGE